MVLMTEPVERPVSTVPVPATEPPTCRESRGNRSTSDVDHGVPGRPCLESESDPSDSRRRRAAVSGRLKPVEPLSPSSLSDWESKKSQPSQLSKTNAHYHKLFKEVRREELLHQSYTCALQRDILYQGKMFVSDSWICFHSKVFGRDTKISIPVTSVTFIKKTKTARLVPNALVIETSNEQHVFVSFLSRNTTFKLLKSLCCHLEVEKVVSPVSCPSSLPLDFSGDFRVLDRMVQHQDMMDSSSSDSQNPDYDKITDFSCLPDSFLSAVTSAEVSVHADVHHPNPPQRHGTPALPLQGVNKGAATRGVPPLPAASLQAVLLLYLFLLGVLVLSSCYMALKIVALEQRLTSLVSLGEHIGRGGVGRGGGHTGRGGVAGDASAEIYGELSSNLLKLDKIQRNLKKLLEET